MDIAAVNLESYSYLLAALVYCALFFRLVQERNTDSFGSAARGVFNAAVLISAIWAACGFAFQHQSSAAWCVSTIALDWLRQACWFFFLIRLLSAQFLSCSKHQKSWPFIFTLALLLISLSYVLITASAAEYFYQPGRLGYFLALAQSVWGLLLIEQLFRNLNEDSRWSAKPLCLGLLCIFGFDLYLFSYAALFGRMDNDASSIRSGVHAIAVPLLFVATNRRPDWLTKIQVSRVAVFHSATLFFVGIYLLFISALGYYVRYAGGDWGRALQLGLLVIALVFLILLTLSGAVRARLRVWVGKHFFRYRYDYRYEWLRFTATLSTKCSPQEMGGLVIRGLADMLESPGGSLWTPTGGGNEISQSARWNALTLTDRESVKSGFCGFLRSKGWIINLDEYRAFPQRYDQLVVPDWLLINPQHWLVIPLLVTDELIGFVVLYKARTSVEVNWEVTDLLKTASRQAASFLAQMHATEALLEVRKFDAFNRMSAFVVHDLKNIVTQLSLMMRNAKRLGGNPEFQQDMLLTVESSLEKMRQLMLQLREGARPPGGLSGVDLFPIVNRLAEVASSRGRTLELDIKDKVIARGHEERVERVLGHVVQNAFDATSPSGRVWLRLERMVGRAQVVVGDTGIGMSEEFINTKLFKPFNTTKQTGMGIGAYESFQYIQELGGSIEVKSEVNRGTVVTIALPLFDTQPESDLKMSMP